MRRELWIATHNLSAAIQAFNALFCSDEDEKQISGEDLGIITLELSNRLSNMMLEDVLQVLNKAMEIKNQKYSEQE